MSDDLIAYDVGDTIGASVTFKNQAGAPTDTTVQAAVLSPDRVESEITATHIGTGLYSVILPLTQPGPYRLRFKGTGALTAAIEVEVDVKYSRFLDP